MQRASRYDTYMKCVYISMYDNNIIIYVYEIQHSVRRAKPYDSYMKSIYLYLGYTHEYVFIRNTALNARRDAM